MLCTDTLLSVAHKYTDMQKIMRIGTFERLPYNIGLRACMPHITHYWKATINTFLTILHMGPCLPVMCSNTKNSRRYA
jgi:hypothetical protein